MKLFALCVGRKGLVFNHYLNKERDNNGGNIVLVSLDKNGEKEKVILANLSHVELSALMEHMNYSSNFDRSLAFDIAIGIAEECNNKEIADRIRRVKMRWHI